MGDYLDIGSKPPAAAGGGFSGGGGGGNPVSQLLDFTLGNISAGIGRKAQVRQNDRLRAHNMVFDKQWAQFQQDMALKMWEATGPQGQKEQLAKAGLNPGLIYGMGGAGGQSIGQSTAQTSNAQAQANSDIPQMMGASAQYALLDAQRKNIEANTAKTNVETNKLAGVDTEAVKTGITKTKAEVDNLMQGLDNLRQTYEVNKLEITAKNIENYEKQASQADRLKYIATNTKTAVLQLHLLNNESTISDQTMNDKIKIIQQLAIGSTIQNELLRENVNLSKEQIRQIANNIELSWQGLDNEHKKIFIQEQLKDYNTDPVNKITEKLAGAIDNIFIMTRGAVMHK